jgi:hypothetical protein
MGDLPIGTHRWMRAAKSTKGLTLFTRHHTQWVDRRARIALKKGCGQVCPRKRQPRTMRTARTKSDSFIPAEPEGASPISSHNGANRLAKQAIWVLRALIKYLRDDPNEGNRWTEGVAHWGIAAT